MKVVSLEDSEQPTRGSAVTIGAYDGVHLGHRQLIAQLRRLAGERNLVSVVVTFDRHPATVLRPGSAPPLLTDLDQKLELLEHCGVDEVLVIHFDRARSEESAEDFVNEVLVRRLNARLVVVGENFHFGHDRRGDVALLEAMGGSLGFEVISLEMVDVEGHGAVSSTVVRRLIAAGDVAGAARLLGRAHEVRGVVVSGDRRGSRVLGFPTANVAVDASIALPAEGVYAGWYVRAGTGPFSQATLHPAAISVGRRPTFYRDRPDAQLVLEAHLLDFDDELYGERAGVRFEAWLHPQREFAQVDELVEQMRIDVAAARATVEAT